MDIEYFSENPVQGDVRDNLTISLTIPCTFPACNKILKTTQIGLETKALNKCPSTAFLARYDIVMFSLHATIRVIPLVFCVAILLHNYFQKELHKIKLLNGSAE